MHRPLTRRMVNSSVRALLAAIGGCLIARGVMHTLEWQPIGEGAAPILAGLFWSWFEERKTQRHIKRHVADAMRSQE